MSISKPDEGRDKECTRWKEQHVPEARENRALLAKRKYFRVLLG